MIMSISGRLRRSVLSFCIPVAALIISAGTMPAGQEAAPSKRLRPLEYNKDMLVIQAVVGFIAPAGLGDSPYDIDPDGKIRLNPGTGSITYNFRSGDSAIDLAGDHVEPAVTLFNPGAENSRSGRESRGLNTLACIGNRVKIWTGEGKGAIGSVIGKHGGAEHVMVDFPDASVFEKLTVGDKMQITAVGFGLELRNAPGVTALNIGPELIEALTGLGMGITPEGKLRIPVAIKVPAKIMGSGLGADNAYRGDYDIQMFDEKTVKECGLDRLRFGDLVGIVDADATYGRIYRQGAITVGSISHSRSYVAGHGPGVTALFTSKNGDIELVEDRDANLATLLKIR
jgi:hypothetical protein